MKKLDLSLSAIKEGGDKTRLYHLPPIGFGTGYVESLSSYVMRLAEAHCVKPGSLLKYEILPLLPSKYVVNGFKSYSYIYRMNGISSFATDIVRSLEKLTLCNDLKLLTLTLISEIFSIENVLDVTRSWCPKCFQYWRNEYLTVYEPLIWSFSKIGTCPIHKIPLETLCPKCHKSQRTITFSSRTGYCYFCHTWLGQIELYPNTPKKNMNSDLDWERWLSKNLIELLTNFNKLNTIKNKEFILSNLVILMDKIGGLVALSKKVGITHSTILDWCKGRHIPNFNLFLQFCYALDISPLIMLTSNDFEPTFKIIKMRKGRGRNRIDIKQCKVLLKNILNRYPVPPLREIKKELGCGENFLRCHFPELINLLVTKHKDFRTKEKDNRRKQIIYKVRETIMELHAEGQYPSSNKVIARIGNKHLFFNYGVRDTWLEMLSELGYK